LVVDSPWWEAYINETTPYLLLLRLFIDDRISATEYELLFFRLYKQDSTHWPEEIYQLLDGLFGDADEFTSEPALRADVGGIDGSTLRDRAKIAYDRLRVLSRRQDPMS
jgi:hypothetical protein